MLRAGPSTPATRNVVGERQGHQRPAAARDRTAAMGTASAQNGRRKQRPEADTDPEQVCSLRRVRPRCAARSPWPALTAQCGRHRGQRSYHPDEAELLREQSARASITIDVRRTTVSPPVPRAPRPRRRDGSRPEVPAAASGRANRAKSCVTFIVWAIARADALHCPFRQGINAAQATAA